MWCCVVHLIWKCLFWCNKSFLIFSARCSTVSTYFSLHEALFYLFEWFNVYIAYPKITAPQLFSCFVFSLNVSKILFALHRSLTTLWLIKFASKILFQIIRSLLLYHMMTNNISELWNWRWRTFDYNGSLIAEDLYRYRQRLAVHRCYSETAMNCCICIFERSLSCLIV